jgi:hypothetical protein
MHCTHQLLLPVLRSRHRWRAQPPCSLCQRQRQSARSHRSVAGPKGYNTEQCNDWVCTPWWHHPAPWTTEACLLQRCNDTPPPPLARFAGSLYSLHRPGKLAGWHRPAVSSTELTAVTLRCCWVQAQQQGAGSPRQAGSPAAAASGPSADHQQQQRRRYAAALEQCYVRVAMRGLQKAGVIDSLPCKVEGGWVGGWVPLGGWVRQSMGERRQL